MAHLFSLRILVA